LSDLHHGHYANAPLGQNASRPQNPAGAANEEHPLLICTFRVDEI
jgi:hypothetical protein